VEEEGGRKGRGKGRRGVEGEKGREGPPMISYTPVSVL